MSVGIFLHQAFEVVARERWRGMREAAGQDGAPFAKAQAPEIARGDAKAPKPEL